VALRATEQPVDTLRIGTIESNDVLLEHTDGAANVRLVNLSPAVPDALVLDCVVTCLGNMAIEVGALVVTYNGANGWVIRVRIAALVERLGARETTK